MTETITAKIYIDQVGRFQARIGEIRKTGHSIYEDSGVFMVRSIMVRGMLVRDATRAAAEILITNEWSQFSAARVPETSRDLDLRFETAPIEGRIAELQLRNNLAPKVLRPLLKPGDRIRANKAECNAREASFTFSHWEGGWIVSNGGSSISPASVYSINGKVFRV